MRVVTINVRKDLRPDKIRADVQRAVTLGDIVLWQEIETDNHRRAIASLGSDWCHAFSPDGLCLSWKASRFTLIEKQYVQTHPGRRAITPARGIQWVILEQRLGGCRFAVLNTHAVSGGWSKGWRPTTRWRRRMWTHHMAVFVDVIRRLHLRGYALIGGGDMNRSRVRFLGDAVTYDNHWDVNTHGNRLYDYLFHLPTARIAIRWSDTQVVRGFHTDHDAVVGDCHVAAR